MDCNAAANRRNCPCRHPECPQHGVCCECLRYHLGLKQLPACCFPPEIARTDERSFRKFAQIHS